MAKQTINIGASPNDGTGTPLRTSFDYCNQNFTELYTSLGGGTGLPGLNGEVIFNNGTSLAGDSGLTFNPATDTLRAGLLIVPGNTQLATVGILYVGSLGSPKLKVDVAGTGETTIASATITGDLAVRTTGLTVNSSGVGIGLTAALGAGNIQIGAGKYLGYSASAYITPEDNVQGARIKANVVLIDAAATANFNIGGTTAMTLNSTGLGVGVAPTLGLNVLKPSDTSFTNLPVIANFADSTAMAAGVGGGIVFSGRFDGTSSVTGYGIISGVKENGTSGNFAGALVFGTRDAGGNVNIERLRINSSGNVGVGVTPSAINAGRGLEVGAVGNGLWCSNSTFNQILQNAYYNSGFKYAASASTAASRLEMGGGFNFYIAPAGTAGNAITFTQAMTLDASGNLLVGKTAVGTTVGIEARPDGYFITTRSESTDVAAFTNAVYSTGASAYRFYVGMGGTVYATNTTISAISDARFKENVQDIDVGLGAILALKPRKFDWKEGKGKNIKGDRGFIAQEFEQVFPQLVDEWADPAPEGEAPYKSVRQDLIPVLVKAIQELTARVEALEA